MSSKRQRKSAPSRREEVEEAAEYASGSQSDEDEYANHVAVGTETTYSANIIDTLNSAAMNGQDFISIPLFHPRFRCDPVALSVRQGSFGRSDMALDDEDWTSNVVGQFSYWIDLDNADEGIRSSSEAALKREYLYGCHLGLQTMILGEPKFNSPNLARSLLSLLKTTPPTAAQIWIRIPLKSAEVPDQDGWKVWDNLRHSVGHHPRLHIALEVADDLKCIPEESLRRWAAEPVKAVVLTTKCFGLNKAGSKPTLTGKHSRLLHTLFPFKIHVIVRGRPLHPQLTLKQYMRCIERLCAQGPAGQGQGPFTLYDKFAFPFRDNLQCPLHPLSDNLDSETYRVMEKDPVKYSQYELAVKRALEDLWAARTADTSNGSSSSSGAKKDKKRALSSSTSLSVEPLVVMVVGAGRGPLVQATLNASEETGIPVKVFAVEKNFNAVVTLRNRFFAPLVTVLYTDMRQLPSLVVRLGVTLCADIIVSELLGSWGDNELSSECLDTVQRFLRPDSGVMIPQSYESYLAPMASSKLWMSARDMFPHSDPRTGLDSPYVVNLHSVHVPVQAKPLFRFVHPNPLTGADNQHNQRYLSVSFTLPESLTLHGFAGYFDCVLYKEVTFSTVPHTHSPGMFSWFPLYVPLRSPLRVNPGDGVTVAVWRSGDHDRVWYEWSLIQPQSTIVQNANGVSYCVKL